MRSRLFARPFFVCVVACFAAMGFSSQAFGQQDGGSQPPEVFRVAKFDVSPPLRTITPILFSRGKKAKDDAGNGPVGNFQHDPDPVVQTEMGAGAFNRPLAIPPTSGDFAGMTNTQGITPPDPNGDIGPNHYVQMVNSRFQIFTRAGVSVFGPATINTLFTGFGGACEVENPGDPVVLYDQLADRWLLSQFSDNNAPFFNCVAISTTGDPTGTYFRYAISAPAFPDYPKYGVWPDAYVLTTRETGGGVLGIYGLDRLQMIAGNPAATVVRFTVSESATQGPNGLLAADVDGNALPPAGSPNYLVGSRDNGTGAPDDALILFKFKPNFVTPASSTFTGPTVLTIAAFDTIFPCGGAGRACIPQPGTATMIDILSYRQRPTFRLAYRNFGTHESMVTTQSVEATAGMAGMRWWEIRDPGGTPFIHQEGTYAPADGIHRWMGSIAMDRAGNMALGYSVSNGTGVFPGIRYTGRLASDPLGTMPQGEGTIVSGGGSQTSTANRWGDYSSMNIDPTDDCTFWYTTEYYTTTSVNSWSTRVGSFKFPSCTAAVGARTPADFDGDNKSDIAVFRPATGTWFVLKSQTLTSDQFQFGQNGDVPVDADFDGDRKADHAVWRPTTGEWFYRRSSNATFGGAVWGANGDKPVPADFDGDGTTDLAVWRPSNGINYIVRSSGGFLGVQWGTVGDVPSHTDLNNDGKADFAIFRRSTGTWFTLLNGTSTTEQLQFGQNGDIPVRGDFDGDLKGDIAVWRPTTGEWFYRRSSNLTFGGLQWGASIDRAVPGDYDGDAKTDFGVWRSTDGIHYIVRNSGGFLGIQWGASGDIPILAAP